MATPTTQTPATTATKPKRTDYHYITSVMTDRGTTNTRDGILTVPSGYTRAKAFKYLMDQLVEEYGTPITVLYFEFQPNQL
jgi:hypothetical protein